MKTEIIQQANEKISAAHDGDSGHVDGAIDFCNTVKAVITREVTTLNIDEKLGILTESGTRRIVEGDPGHGWTSPREVGSIYDDIYYIVDQCGKERP